MLKNIRGETRPTRQHIRGGLLRYNGIRLGGESGTTFEALYGIQNGLILIYGNAIESKSGSGRSA